jgi:ring-1,2-phenylacetyl-CoA epoxidase subunit PaaD
LDTTVKPTEREDVLRLLETVKDPELPVLSIIDLGIVRDVLRDETDDVWLIRITPTYSGCPAMDMIATQIRMTLYAAGLTAFRIETVLSPAWTTDWMNDDAKERLRAYGIAPPEESPPCWRDVPRPWHVRGAGRRIRAASASSARRPASRSTDASPAASPSTISNAIEKGTVTDLSFLCWLITFKCRE